jgi:hypothetical protein
LLPIYQAQSVQRNRDKHVVQVRFLQTTVGRTTEPTCPYRLGMRPFHSSATRLPVLEVCGLLPETLLAECRVFRLWAQGQCPMGASGTALLPRTGWAQRRTKIDFDHLVAVAIMG